jgi:hypothetical protein
VLYHSNVSGLALPSAAGPLVPWATWVAAMQQQALRPHGCLTAHPGCEPVVESVVVESIAPRCAYTLHSTGAVAQQAAGPVLLQAMLLHSALACSATCPPPTCCQAGAQH